MLGEDAAVSVLPLRIAGREELPNVALGCRSQQRIRNGMQEHVRVGVPFQSLFARNLDATENQLAASSQAMGVKADSRSELWRIEANDRRRLHGFLLGNRTGLALDGGAA